MNFKEFRQLKESYRNIKDKYYKEADKSEVDNLLDLHKKLKDMKRLPDAQINIDFLTKNKSFDDFKEIMSDYSIDDILTKKDKFKKLNVVAENSEWIVYKIDYPEEAYLFHGLTNWRLCSGDEYNAAREFDKYTNEYQLYFYVRKDLEDDDNDYIAEQYNNEESIYTDKDDFVDDEFNPDTMNFPEFDKEYE